MKFSLRYHLLLWFLNLSTHANTTLPSFNNAGWEGWSEIFKSFGLVPADIAELQNLKKKYQGEITIGATTPSFDLETSVNRRFDFSHVNENDILSTTENFLGITWQTPPIYSALKQNGVRLYSLARRNKSVKIAKRLINMTTIGK